VGNRLAIPARAQDNYEIQVYSDDTVAPGHTMVELGLHVRDHSALACFRMGMSGSASFQTRWKSISGFFCVQLWCGGSAD
jgi:hypothetical protein